MLMLEDLDEHDIAEIALFISSERLAAFRAIAGNERDAILIHQQVLAVGTGMAAVIAVVEIALRNTVCEHLRSAFGVPGWLKDPPAPFEWGDEELAKIKEAERHAQRACYAKLNSTQKRTLDTVAYPNGVPQNIRHETRVKARQKAIQVSSGQIVAQLTIYFWKRLFSDDYEDALWKRSLRQIFPNKRINRADVSKHLEILYQARNRVAHHEPVYGDRLDETLAAVEFICFNFQSRRPSDATPLCKLIRPYREVLDIKVEELRTTLSAFTTPSIASQA
jgi:hypothetical protein